MPPGAKVLDGPRLAVHLSEYDGPRMVEMAVRDTGGGPPRITGPRLLFEDGFESGDLSAWSAAAP